MCVVSMVGDYYKERWTAPEYTPVKWDFVAVDGGPTQAEFDALKKEVLEMKELLRRAKLYDEQNGEKDCEIEDKVAVLRKVADLVGVDLSDVLRVAP